VERWAYVANIRLPSERADAVQVLNQCQALMETGLEVTLYCAWRLFKSPEAGRMADLRAAFGLERCPKIIQVPCLDLTRLADRLDDEGLPARLIFLLQHLSFLLVCLGFLVLTRPAAVYTREIHLAWAGGGFLKRLGVRLLVELHNLPGSPRGLSLLKGGLRRSDGVVVISRGLAEDLRAAGLTPPRLVVAPDAAAEVFFRPLGSKRKLREELGLPPEGPVLVYTGGLYYAWKGVADLIRAQAEMRERAWLVIVGGSPLRSSLDRLEELVAELGLKKVLFTGWVPPSAVPGHLQAADVLVLPNSGRSRISRRYTSPLKLFEYLASGRPVAATDLESVREVLDPGTNALLARPDDPPALARAVETILDDPDLAQRLARAGQETARAFTWSKRAETIRALLR